jgi:hypothetical protein
MHFYSNLLLSPSGSKWVALYRILFAPPLSIQYKDAQLSSMFEGKKNSQVKV